MRCLQLFPKSSRMAASSSSSSENSNFKSESDGLDSDSDYDEIDEDQADEVADVSKACSEFSLAFFKVCIAHTFCHLVIHM